MIYTRGYYYIALNLLNFKRFCLQRKTKFLKIYVLVTEKILLYCISILMSV